MHTTLVFFNKLFKLYIYIYIYFYLIFIQEKRITIKYFIKSFKLIHKFTSIKDSFLNILKLKQKIKELIK